MWPSEKILIQGAMNFSMCSAHVGRWTSELLTLRSTGAQLVTVGFCVALCRETISLFWKAYPPLSPLGGAASTSMAEWEEEANKQDNSRMAHLFMLRSATTLYTVVHFLDHLKQAWTFAVLGVTLWIHAFPNKQGCQKSKLQFSGNWWPTWNKTLSNALTIWPSNQKHFFIFQFKEFSKTLSVKN